MLSFGAKVYAGWSSWSRRGIDLMHTYPPDSVSSRTRLSSTVVLLPSNNKLKQTCQKIEPCHERGTNDLKWPRASLRNIFGHFFMLLLFSSASVLPLRCSDPPASTSTIFYFYICQIEAFSSIFLLHFFRPLTFVLNHIYTPQIISLHNFKSDVVVLQSTKIMFYDISPQRAEKVEKTKKVSKCVIRLKEDLSSYTSNMKEFLNSKHLSNLENTALKFKSLKGFPAPVRPLKMAGFMTCAAAGLQGTIKMFQLHSWGFVVSSIFINLSVSGS